MKVHIKGKSTAGQGVEWRVNSRQQLAEDPPLQGEGQAQRTEHQQKLNGSYRIATRRTPVTVNCG